jgi:hypothetical protein
MKPSQKPQTFDPLKRLVYLLCRIVVLIFTRIQYLIIFILPLLPILVLFTALTTDPALDRMFQIQEDGTMSGSVEGPFFFITSISAIAFAIFVLKSKFKIGLIASFLLFGFAAFSAIFGSFEEPTNRLTVALVPVFGGMLYILSLFILRGADWILGKIHHALGLKN